MNLIIILLTIYIWTVVAILLYFLFAIARFYESKSGRRAYYPAFLGAMILFLVAAVRYILIAPTLIGDVWGDLLRFAGSLILGGFGLHLLNLMIGSRSSNK
ncbi:MAG: hypothetical protein R3264_14400 [Anaerolineae bacterium]|nr:hypothetical protein [Anaerolineae bacterium]